MLAWILTYAGRAPGFLIGGIAPDLQVSARSSPSDCFVIEADEYDTAFFDKRSKFVHYRPKTAILGNLEFDHADIFSDLAAIERQFHHQYERYPRKIIVNGRRSPKGTHPRMLDVDRAVRSCRRLGGGRAGRGR
jgi:UDP-N-acetylmuramate: L-alanyl-gamma-D-glutamyl-meso-diaminopimelate ligase